MNKTNLENNLGSIVSHYSDTIKGLLIIIVVADHNDWFRICAPNLFLPLTFHVLGFFFLSFSFPSIPFERNYIVDRVARYLVPFWISLITAAIAFNFFFSKDFIFSGLFYATLKAALLGNAPYVKSASGLLMLWFLPCLFCLTVVRAINDRFWSNQTRVFLITFWTLVHTTITLVPHNTLFLAPFGFAIVLAIFVLCLAWRSLLNYPLPKCWGPAASLVFIASSTYLIFSRVHIEIATLDIPTIKTPLKMIIHDLSAISGMLALAWFAKILKFTRLIDVIGRQSLLIYLLHPIIYQVIGRFLMPPPVSSVHPTIAFANACITALLAILLSYIFATLIARTPILSSLVIPRHWVQWLPIRAIKLARR